MRSETAYLSDVVGRNAEQGTIFLDSTLKTNDPHDR